MNIILYVDFKSSQINNDFRLANALTEKHTILLVTSKEQLLSSCKAYEIVLVGQSVGEFNIDINNKIIKVEDNLSLEELLLQIDNIQN